MKLSKIKLFAVLTVMMVFSAPTFAKDDSQAEKSRNDPGQYSENYNRGGCFVTFFDKKNFRGRSVTMTGNRFYRNIDLERAFGFEPDSLIVGNRANIWLYDGDGFDDLEYYFRAGTGARRVNDLDSIDSLEIRCL